VLLVSETGGYLGRRGADVDRAFSAVVADNQFANLGLMLVGTLARFQKIIGPLKRGVEDEENDKLEVKDSLVGQDGHDFGEVIEREAAEEISAEVTRTVEDEEDLVVQNRKRSMAEAKDDSVAEIRPLKKKKKRKKDYDEFDALFGRLS
jgi:ribonuclease MRP protein subunit RMP1